ncbi:MAG: hypothetical protein ACLPVO_14245 [Desulfomonilaceae bacterium]
MITRKKTLEMVTPRRTGDEESARTKEFTPEVLDRVVEIGSPLDDLEFGETVLETSSRGPSENPEKPQKLDKPGNPEKPVNPVVEKRASEVTKFEAIKKLYRLPKKYNMLVLIGLALLCLIIGLYLLGKQSYTVETRLVFIVSDRNALEKENWSPMRELSLLQNPKTTSVLSSKYFSTVDPMNFFNKVDGNTVDSLFSQSTVVNPMLVKTDFYKTPVDFESWISKSITFEPDFYGGQNGVAIKLTGPDPQLLKGVLLDYVSSYVDLRRVVAARSKEKGKPNSPAPAEVAENSQKLKSLENLNEKIKKLDLLLNDYQLAMTLMDSNNGSMSSFSIDPNSPIFSTLARFQDKIIQLEIERGSLETRFTPQSREIKSVDFQIDGVKGLMRQYLTEQIKYLNNDKDMLIAQTKDFENSPQPKSEIAEGPKDMSKSSGMLASGAKWYFLNNGLSVINENPFVTSKPLLGRIGDFKDALLASLFSSGNGGRSRQPSGPYIGAMNSPYGGATAGQYYDPPQFRGGPTADPVARQSQPMDFYHNDMSSFVRR